MELQKISGAFFVRKLTEEDVEAVYALCAENPLFYQYCPPFVTRRSIREDMAALPPNTGFENKYYAGFFDGETLAAVMDLILEYPDRETAFIGLFMMNRGYQGRGTGSSIVSDCVAYLAEEGFRRIRLAFAKGNPQSEAFWRKNGFSPTGVEIENQGYTAVVMERHLR